MREVLFLFLVLFTGSSLSEAPKVTPSPVNPTQGSKLNLPSTDSSTVRFTNVLNGQVLTVNGTASTPGLNIIAAFWKGLGSQKWRVLERGDVYLLLPSVQHKEWANFLKRTKDRGGDNLPSITVVAGIDVNNAAIVQQVLHGRSNQQWTFTKVGEERVLIESPGRGKCIGPKIKPEDAPSFYDRAKQKIKGIFASSKPQTSSGADVPLELIALDCNEEDERLQWRIEPVTK